ncbi:hypothetical protein LZ023_38635 (plasmid) [Pseudomonas silvicola]|nr:hypothetical protein LZ023_38635 [Pseudomonas silvicola]
MAILPTPTTTLPYTNTLLTNNANIYGSQDRQIGFIASSSGQLINNGDIALEGSNTVGLWLARRECHQQWYAVSITNGSSGLYSEGYTYSVAARATNNARSMSPPAMPAHSQPSVGGVAFGDAAYFSKWHHQSVR